MKLDGHFELELPSAPDTAGVRIARWLSIVVWLVAGTTLLACAFPQPGAVVGAESWLLAVLGIIAATTLSILVLQLCDRRDESYWTEARIRQRQYPIWLLAFGLRRRGPRS